LRKKRRNQNLKTVQKYWMIFLIVKDHQTIRQDWDMIKINLTKDLTLHLRNLIKNPKSYAVSLQSSFKKKENKIKNDSNQHKSAKENEFRWNTITRRTPPKGINISFLDIASLAIILGIKQ
jgi:hypothetical protein